MSTALSDDNKPFFHPRRLGHVNLWVEDLERSESFYSASCGLVIEFTEPDLIATFLGTGATPHDLGMIQMTRGIDRYGRNGLLQLPGTIGREVGLNHLAWELENEAVLVEAYRRLKQESIETDITVDHQVAHSVYMFDPDGNYNEFYCDTVKDWRNVLGGPMELLTSHWDPLENPPFQEGRYEENPELHTVSGAAVQPRRVTHAVLQTANMNALVDFYTRIAGLDIVDQRDGAVYLRGGLSNYSHHLVLVPADKPAYHHVAFELAGEAELKDAISRLAESEIEIVKEVDLPWKRSFFLKDPDGLQSEWYVARNGERRLSERQGIPLAYAV